LDEERIRVLQMVEAGTISAEEGVKLLEALEASRPASEPPPELVGQWRHAWLYVLYAGVGIVIAGGLLLFIVYAGGSVLWGVCGWPLLLAGVLVTVIGAWSRTARWLHVRVAGHDHRVAVSLPLPLKLTAWGIRVARRFVPKFEETGLDEVIMGLDDATGAGGQPFYVSVTDEDDGEHVQVYIG
jgi:hypothetical protein